MNAATFAEYFQQATGNHPYGYQCRLADGAARHPCESLLIDIPTGLGKADA